MTIKEKDFEQLIKKAHEQIDNGEFDSQPVIVEEHIDGHRDFGHRVSIYNDQGRGIVFAVVKEVDEQEKI